MRSIEQRWLDGALLLCLWQTSLALQAPNKIRRTRSQLELLATFDPSHIASLVSSHTSHPEIPALLSTALTSALQPAHGHSNPLFGPPDPYLAAGKSIAPSAKALLDMGITQVKAASEIAPQASPNLQQSITAAMKGGWNVLDSSHIKNLGTNNLPGFTDTRGIFGARSPTPESPESFAADVKWAAGYFKVMDKLPFVAFWYAMLEFFILRPGVDLYREEIEDDPAGVVADSLSVGVVRAAAFAIISILALVFSG